MDDKERPPDGAPQNINMKDNTVNESSNISGNSSSSDAASASSAAIYDVTNIPLSYTLNFDKLESMDADASKDDQSQCDSAKKTNGGVPETVADKPAKKAEADDSTLRRSRRISLAAEVSPFAVPTNANRKDNDKQKSRAARKHGATTISSIRPPLKALKSTRTAPATNEWQTVPAGSSKYKPIPTVPIVINNIFKPLDDNSSSAKAVSESSVDAQPVPAKPQRQPPITVTHLAGADINMLLAGTSFERRFIPGGVKLFPSSAAD